MREREIGIEVNATSVFEDAKITLMLGGQALFERNVSLSPGKAFVQRIMIENAVRPQELKLVVQTPDGHGIVYSPPEKKDRPLPEVYRRPDSPETFGSADALFLAGSRLEQYGDPNLDPVKYYEEALKRDPRHVFANTGLGVWYLKRDLYHKAEPYLRTAVGQVTGNYTRARYGEPLYYLGLCLYLLGREEEAIEILGQAAWNREWASQAFTLTGVMACSGGELDAACDLFLKAVEADGTNTEARVFRAVVLRRLGKKEQALELIDEVLSFDPLNLLALYERGLLSGMWGGRPDVEQKRILDHFREEPDNYLETAARYRMLGFDREAVNILSAGTGRSEKLSDDPMIRYYLGYFYNRLGEKENSEASCLKASELPVIRCFPHGTASMRILEAVLEKNPRDAAAHYLLGNVLADNDPERAVEEWSKAIALDPKKAAYYRNMAFIEANVLNRMEEALAHIEKAVQLNPSDPRTLYEADVYAEYADIDPELRLQKLAKYPETVKKWDKLQLRDISLRNIAGFHDEAIDKLKSNHFYVAEGTHINPHLEWTNAHLYRGIDRLASGKNHQALADFKAVFEFPRNLETTADDKTAVAYYWMGKCLQALSDSSQAMKAFEELSGFRNKQGWGGTGTPLVQFFKGLALVELGESGKADTVFQRLFIQGRDGMDEKSNAALDLKGVRVRQDQKNRSADAFLSMALGLIGKGELEQAEIVMNKVTET